MEAIYKDVFDEEKTKKILYLLKQGKEIKEIAKYFGHKTWKSIDMHMRRRGYKWNGEKGVYVINKKSEPIQSNKFISDLGRKEEQVIYLFSQGNSEAKVIAEQLGFSSHGDMAVYMKSKGFCWSSDINNYVQKNISQSVTTVHEKARAPKNKEAKKDLIGKQENIDKFIPLLQELEKKWDVIVSLIGKVETSAYKETKFSEKLGSVLISEKLLDSVKQLSKKKGTSCTQLIETAIMEILMR